MASEPFCLVFGPGVIVSPLWGAAWAGMQAPAICEMYHPFSCLR